MTDTRQPPSPHPGARLPVPQGGRPRGDGPWPGGEPGAGPEGLGHGPRVEIRTAAIRLPGLVGLLLAIPAFFLFGLVAIMLLVAGAVGMLVGPWMLRRMVRQMEREAASQVPSGDTTIELDPSAYAERDQERSAISRSSSSRKRGNTSE